MSDLALQVARDHHAAGEYKFVPDELTLSLVTGQPLSLEQDSEGRLWVVRSTRGSINVMPAGIPRVFRHRQGCSFACITVPGVRALSVRPALALRDEPLRLILEGLVAAADSGDDTRLFRDAIGFGVVARLLHLDGRPPAPTAHGLSPRALSRVVAYLDAHLADDVSVEDLARVAGLRPAHFSLQFRRSFGEPPHRHMIRMRVERAKLLIEQGLDPAAAAVAVGFYDQSHLARHMRRMLGVTPGQVASVRA
jgi:AraC family transcriptional regulator